MNSTIYRFTAQGITGNTINFEQYKGKVLLIVNTASQCGFTWHYKDLQELFDEFNQRGFEILAFPCNQFGNQEPGTEQEISNFCKSNYGVTFQMFKKIEVNGDNAHPVFKYLTNSLPGFLNTKAIKWNFTKFLVDKNGIPVERIASTTRPDKLRASIEKLINQ